MKSPNSWFDGRKAGAPEPDDEPHGDKLTTDGTQARSVGIAARVQ
jgi:hypothetical protein